MVWRKRIYNWTATQRENAKAELERKAIKLYLRAWNTQENIAEELGVTRQTISNILSKNSTNGKYGQDFQPYLYNIWNLHKAERDTSHFGYFPEIFMENLLAVLLIKLLNFRVLETFSQNEEIFKMGKSFK
jgi:transcriptional regulator with XRE-family HTH domain